MTLWGRLAGNSDNHPNHNISGHLFEAVVDLWVTGGAAGGITGAQALVALGLDAGEQVQANRLKTAMSALASVSERREAASHLAALMTLHEQDKAPFTTGADIEQSLVDWFAAKSVTF